MNMYQWGIDNGLPEDKAKELEKIFTKLEVTLEQYDKGEIMHRNTAKMIGDLSAENKLKQAEIEGLGSALLDVQQDCVALRKELGQLRVEGARSDDC